MRIVEINDNDIYGKVFNGYDIMEKFNHSNSHKVNQLVIHKYSSNPNVHSYFLCKEVLELEKHIYEEETNKLSTHSLLSISSDYLLNHKLFQKADLVHFHQFHNSHFNLTSFLEMTKNKPAVISFHDPWFMTGRCVHPNECQKWKSGCEKCNKLGTLFAFSKDNCDELWKIKSEVIKNSDPDIIVSSEFMLNMIKKHPYTKDLTVHVLPFGIDTTKYEFKTTKEEAKKILGINPEDIVIFFRSAEEKGVKYIIDALKQLKTKKKITLLTCAEIGLLGEIEKKYNIIELGYIEESIINQCYNASDIFLMPSLGESFGMMAIEAMASSLPVVVFDNTALPTVTSAPDVGILVKNKDSKDLHDKIKKLIDEEDYRINRGVLGRELVNKKYKIEKYYSDLNKIYEQAHNRQIKEKHKKETKRLIDYKNKEVQKLLPKLQEIYISCFPNEKSPSLFDNMEKVRKSHDSKIKYSDINVQNVILEFNKILYNKAKKIEKENFSIKQTKIYQLLKKSRILRIIVNKLRHIIKK